MYRDVRSKWVGEPEYRAWTFSFELLKRKNWLCPSPTSARLHLKLVILTNDFKFESFPSKSSMSVENYFCSWRERERSVLRSCGHVWIVQLTHTRALHSSGAQHSTVTATSPCFWFNFDCFSFISILCCLYRHNESNIEKTWQLYRSQPSSTLQHGTDGVESFGFGWKPRPRNKQEIVTYPKSWEVIADQNVPIIECLKLI